MKQITKKQIKEAPEFILVIDWRAEKREKYSEPFTYYAMQAKSILEAMNEAEHNIDDSVYLVKVLEKTTEIDPDMGIIYSAILANRHNGWHTNDYDHAEGPFRATYNPLWSYDPITFYGGI